MEKPPSFPARKTIAHKKYGSFPEYVEAEKHYSTMASRKGIGGSVLVSFVVGVDGKVYDIQLLTSRCRYLDMEAARVIIDSPRWKPGKQKGKPMPVSVSQSIGFYK